MGTKRSCYVKWPFIDLPGSRIVRLNKKTMGNCFSELEYDRERQAAICSEADRERQAAICSEAMWNC